MSLSNKAANEYALEFNFPMLVDCAELQKSPELQQEIE